MHRPRSTAVLCGALLTTGLIAVPAQASSTSSALVAQAAVSSLLTDTLSDTPVLKPRPTPTAASRPSGETAAAAGRCAPEIVSQTVTPRRLKVGTTHGKSSLLHVVLNDPCDVVGYLTMDYWRTSGTSYASGHMAWDGRDDDGLFHASTVLTADPATLTNDLAGTWDWGVSLMTYDDEFVDSYDGSTFFLQRYSRLTNNASPEPVRKGGTITVTGLLERASWDTQRYAGYAAQPVVLQARTPTGSYATLTTLTTDAAGRVSYRVRATKDLCFRYAFVDAPTTTPAVTAGGDCVDVV